MSRSLRRGYVVTSPLLPELLTEGRTISEALANVEDAFEAVVELYEFMEKPLPPDIYSDEGTGAVSVEAVVAVS